MRPKLFHNAHIYTMKSKSDTAKGLLVDEYGYIVDVLYSQQELNAIIKQNIPAYDLSGNFVYPGFIDTHTHAFEGGLYGNTACLEQAESIDDVIDLLKASEPVNGITVGYHLDENRLREKRLPLIGELDKAFPSQPCLIRRIDGHLSIINSVLYRQANVAQQAAKLFSAQQLQKVHSHFKGVLKAELNDYISGWFHKNINEEGIRKAYVLAARKAARKGLTTVHTMVGDGDSDILHYDTISKLINKQPGLFAVDFVLYPQVFDFEAAYNRRCKRIGGCILADGSFGSGTAALTVPYRNNPDNYGILYKNDDRWYRFIKKAHEHDMQVAVHCIGDKAIKQIVDIYSRIQEENPKDYLRHQVIHCELMDEDLTVNRMADNNIAAVVQPVFDKLWGGTEGMYAQLLGKERALMCNRYRSLLDSGVLVTGSSDWYVTEIDPLAGIDAAVNLHNTQERLEPYEAIQLYTVNAAKLINQDKLYGSLETGKYADFVCLEKDIMTPGNIAGLSVNRVFKRGLGAESSCEL